MPQSQEEAATSNLLQQAGRLLTEVDAAGTAAVLPTLHSLVTQLQELRLQVPLTAAVAAMRERRSACKRSNQQQVVQKPLFSRREKRQQRSKVAGGSEGEDEAGPLDWV